MSDLPAAEIVDVCLCSEGRQHKSLQSTEKRHEVQDFGRQFGRLKKRVRKVEKQRVGQKYKVQH